MRSGKQQINPLESVVFVMAIRVGILEADAHSHSAASLLHWQGMFLMEKYARTLNLYNQNQLTEWVAFFRCQHFEQQKFLITERGRGLTGFCPDRY